MIIINNQYLDKFKLSKHEYLYYLKRGVFLAFDKNTKEYLGIETFGLFDINKLSKEVDDKLNDLISKGYLELL